MIIREAIFRNQTKHKSNISASTFQHQSNRNIHIRSRDITETLTENYHKILFVHNSKSRVQSSEEWVRFVSHNSAQIKISQIFNNLNSNKLFQLKKNQVLKPYYGSSTKKS